MVVAQLPSENAFLAQVHTELPTVESSKEKRARTRRCSPVVVPEGKRGQVSNSVANAPSLTFAAFSIGVRFSMSERRTDSKLDSTPFLLLALTVIL
ncbi:hypothetical protein DWB78_02520 [Halopelagius longus]|uniref:Uncharacterized protein n=1 Tax=Halopelagius longus TaxID=1236180 RepID=A0A370IJ28_9EURY|nr:hypothetical protein DWB78_02520 [Halopelagius longus]